MKKLGLMFLALFMVGCSTFQNQPMDQAEAVALQNYNTFKGYFTGDTFSKSEVPYMKGKIKKYDPILSRYVEIKSVGSVSDLCMSLESVFPSLSFYADETATDIYTSVDFKGALEDTLNNISNKAGVFWFYREAEKSIIFSNVTTRTYIFNTSSSAVTSNASLSNSNEKSSEESGGSAATAQKTETRIDYDVMEEAEETIKELISKDGKVKVNPAAGTITVKDNYMAIRNIDKAIEKINGFLGQQVAIEVKVYAVSLDDTYNTGVNLQTIFSDGTTNFTGGINNISSSLGSISAGIIGDSGEKTGRWSGSAAAVQALKEIGEVSIVNQGSGITTHNQPFALQSTRTEAYLKSITSSTSDYGQDITMEPGEVTEGFSMLFTPSIRGKQVILEYNLSLITLESIENFTAGENTIQLPKLNTKAFSQHAVMTMGETLVIGAFLSDSVATNKNLGLFGFANGKTKQKALIIITVDVDNAGLPMLAKLENN